MKLLVIGSGMMGSAAAYDMARQDQVNSVTLADSDRQRARDVAARVNRIAGNKKVRAVALDASKQKDATRLMNGHDGVLSAVPYRLNLGLAKAAIGAGCHFADLGGNNTVVRQELALAKPAERKGVGLAPDCGLSPGMASILGGELVRRLNGRADALKLYVGGLPERPMPPFHYQLVFSVEGVINEYVEPARILRKGKLTTIESLTEPEAFHMDGFSPLIAFQTSGGTSTLPETFEGKVGECFEKTLRYPGHYDLLCELKALGLFSNEKMRVGNVEVAPRALMSRVFEGKFAGKGPDVLGANGALQGDVTEVRLGDRAASERWRLRTITKDTDRIKPIENLLAGSLSNFRIGRASIVNIEQTDQPFGFNYTFLSENYAKLAGSLLLVRPRVLGNKSSGILETKDPRKFPLEFEGPSRDTDSFDIALPPGYVVDELPPPMDVDYSFGSYHSKTEATGQGCITPEAWRSRN